MSAEISQPGGAVAVVFGATGGIGAELVAELQADPAYEQVFGFSRSGPLPVDLLSEDTIRAAASHVTASGGVVRLVIVATGFLHGDGFAPEKAMRDIDPSHLQRAFGINAIGPALVMKHLLPLLPRTGRAAFVALSARVGSIGDNHLGGWYGYRASKAALNQLVRTAAIELKRRCPQAICVAMHPGTVNTGLSSPFAKTNLDVRTPSQAAHRLLATIARLKAADTGLFFDGEGAPIEW